VSDYEPFDQEAWLGKPPWKPTDAALIAWEAAHGHDVRLKCYTEFGCYVGESVLERERDVAQAALDRVRALCDDAEASHRPYSRILDVNDVRAALDGPSE